MNQVKEAECLRLDRAILLSTHFTVSSISYQEILENVLDGKAKV